MKVKKFIQEPIPGFDMNTYLIKEKDHCILIDPGTISDKLQEALLDCTLDAVLLTHAHFDHILGLNKLNVPVYISNQELPLLKDPAMNYAKQYGLTVHLDRLTIRDIKDFKTFMGIPVITHPTPGHTKGSVCIQLEEHLFTGDTLFVNTVGRTDLATGSTKELMESLKLFQKFSNNTIIYPGHGGSARLNKVKEMNSYLK